MNLSENTILELGDLPIPLSNQLSSDFERLFSLHPNERAKIQMNTANGLIDLETSRWQSSYGNIPSVDDESKFYMFHGKEQKTVPSINEMEPEFQNIMVYLNQIQRDANLPEFNQVTVCWYESGRDHISMHSDKCQNMDVNAGVACVTLCDKSDLVRYMHIAVKGYRPDVYVSNMNIPLPHGRIVHMRGRDAQRLYKHGVPSIKNGDPGPRISLSFRRYTF